MVAMGTYEELISTSTSFARLLEDINQHEHEQEIENEKVTVIKRLSEVNSMISENGNQEDDGKPLPINIETKQEGIVKWNVYISYIRAGIGLTLGLTIMLVVYCG
ncbi:unnamed protein product, partial [Rotaria magnacalcarata]